MSEQHTIEQKIIGDFIDQLAKNHDFKYFFEHMKSGEFPSEYWEVLGQGGYIGMVAPEEYGGTASKAQDLALFLQGMAKKGLASLRLIHQIASCHLLTRFGSEEQKRKMVPGLISGTHFSYANMERTEGMSLYDTAMRASRQGDTYRLNGRKCHVVGAGDSASLIVSARTGPEDRNDKMKGISLFVVDSGAEGVKMIPRELNVRVTGEKEMMMITGDTFFDIEFTDVEVSEADRIGTEGSGGEYIHSASSLIMMMMAATSIGWGENVLEMTVEYAKNRVIYEEPIASYQAVQHPMVRAKTDLEMAKLVLERAAGAMDDGEEQEDVATFTGLAKVAATDAAYHAFDIGIQAHGGSSFDRETGIITLWPLVLLSRIVPLNNEVILERFSETALGLPPTATH